MVPQVKNLDRKRSNLAQRVVGVGGSNPLAPTKRAKPAGREPGKERLGMNGKDTETQEEAMAEENKTPEKTGKRLLTIEEAALYLGLSPRTIYNGVAPKTKNPFPVKVKRIGKLIRFDIRDLEAYVASLGS